MRTIATSPHPTDMGRWAPPVVVVTVSVGTGWALQTALLGRVTLAMALAILGMAMAVRSPRLATYGLIVWYVSLGLIRRLFSQVTDQGSIDPFLLVGLIVTATAVLATGLPEHRHPLDRGVIALQIVLGVACLNPLQGSAEVALSGLALVVFPTLAYWIGRGFSDGDREVWQLFGLLAVVSLPVAAYGYYQIAAGFPSWDQAYIDSVDISSLYLGAENVRAFSSLVAPSDYVAVVGIGIVAWLGLQRSVWMAFKWPAICGLALTVWYSGSRGAVVKVLWSLGAWVIVRYRLPPLRSLIVIAAATVFIPYGVAQVVDGPATTESTTATASARQIAGLTDPFGEDSTLGGHIDRVWKGYASSFENPAGYGTGVIAHGTRQFVAEAPAGGTEFDASNTSIAAGVPGALAFLGVLAGLVWALRTTRAGSEIADPRLMATMVGTIVVTVAAWLSSGNYASMWLTWLVLGLIGGLTDRVVAAREAEEPSHTDGASRAASGAPI